MKFVMFLILFYNWPLTGSNSHITDVPTLQDFVPLGVEFVETPEHELEWNGPAWRLSCFIFVGIGTTEEGDTIIFQLRLPHPVHPGQSSDRFSDKFFINGEWHSSYTLFSPTYYDEGEIFGYPTVYTFGVYRSGDSCIASMSYNESEREWIYRVVPLEGSGDSIEIEIYPRGTTYWMGKPEGPYIIHGAIFNREDIDIWGGFWEIGPCVGRIARPGVGEWEFTGHAIWDRAYHRVYYSDSAIGAAGAPLWFTCGYIYNDDFQLAIGYAQNPSPLNPPVPFQHQGRLSIFVDDTMSFRFDNYELSDNGGLQPSEFHIHGTYEKGEVDLHGEVFLFYPAHWGVYGGVWWDSTAKRTWGRAFIRWTGRITVDDDTIEVTDASGVFENTRYEREQGVEELPRSFENGLKIRPLPNGSSVILEYYIPKKEDVEIDIYDIMGRRVYKVRKAKEAPGNHRIVWKGGSSGVYFVVLKCENSIVKEKFLKLR
ncbi:MAG: hypothetical protein DRO95_04990 [Candidatus Altiarchaeales archaeon]|nr:MAG: hypothetical protein DRO95_04990 [Candidatus Altiarchaeales archaeon]